MEEFIIKDGKRLRMGYTTGSCAAAAAKAAAWMLLTGREKKTIQLHTPKGIDLNMEVCHIERTDDFVRCSIEKDSGDDPDITRGMHVYATVSYAENCKSGIPEHSRKKRFAETITLEGSEKPSVLSELTGTVRQLEMPQLTEEKPLVEIDGGRGIGRVTKPGLDQPVGAAAINSVPRQMIRENVEEVMRETDFKGHLKVLIEAPEGENLARKTFNPRLGIVGGLSILGTTGIVEPMSEQALVDTIAVELKQRRANGAEYILLTPGNYGSDYIKEAIGIDPRTAVLTSNFIGDALTISRELGFKGALLIGHIGKLVKLAGGMFNTHSKYGDCRLEILAAHAAAVGLRQERVAEMLSSVTCDDGLRILKEEDLMYQTHLCEATLQHLQEKIEDQMAHKVYEEMEVGAILFSKEYGYLCETKHAGNLLEKIL